MMLGAASPRSKMTGKASGLRCFGLISARTATLLLALLGLVAHLQTFRNLAVLHDSFPHVPKLRSTNAAVAISDNVTRYPASSVSSAFQHRASSSSAATDAVQTIIPEPTGSSDTSLADDYLALVRPTRWFNLLPKRPWSEDWRAGSSSSPEEMALWQAQQADQDDERRNWETARRLTVIMRVYALLSAAACVMGLYGVVKSNLASSRIFVLSSILDVFLFALSLVSFCIVITYPGVRAMLCEQISSGEIHALLSYMHGANHDAATPVAGVSTVDAAAALITSSGTASSTASSTPALQPAARFLSYATGPLWKRAVSGSSNSSTFARIYWWDTLLDDMLENESCDDIFASVLVPLGLVICLAYLALRIHFLFVIRSYYVALLRNRAEHYLCAGGASNGARGMLVVEDKPLRKYSSSSSSSSTAVEMGGVGRSKLAEKVYSDKIA